MTVKVGVFGTSWWVDSMYLPALQAHDQAEVVAVCGRDPDRAAAFADRWGIPKWFTDEDEMFSQQFDAVVIATPNNTHALLATEAISRGIHVLCEKPLATSYADARHVAEAAVEANLTTMVPFTYRYMPSNQWVKRLIDDGFIGRPHHLGLRYFTSFGRNSEYSWRFDEEVAGSGVLGDLGSHWLDMASWLVGEIVEIGATTEHMVDRDLRPDGSPYVQGEDSALITVRYANGANGILQVSSMCWEGDGFGQVHHLDAHGSDGTLHAINDWKTVQEVRGLRFDEPGPAAVVPIPDELWRGARRDTAHNTYRDTFRIAGRMAGDFIDAVAAGLTCEPDLAAGARIQKLLDLAVSSAAQGGVMLQVDD